MTEDQFRSLAKWAAERTDSQHYAFWGQKYATDGTSEAEIAFTEPEHVIGRVLCIVYYRRAKGLPIGDLELPDLSNFFGSEAEDQVS